MTSGVQRVFAQVTRYPLEILDPQASLEGDLGVDSVKLGEVFAVLREQYELPATIGIPPEQLRTIGGIATALAQHLGNGNGHGGNGHGGNGHGGNGHGGHGGHDDSGHPPTPAVEAAPKRSGKHGNGSLEPGGFEAGVRAVFADVTRYPPEILDPGASLEEDLGIDSVKLGEVFAVLREKYELPATIGIPPEELKTIGTIAGALRRYLATVEPAVAEPAPEPAPAASPPGVAAQSFAALTPQLKPFTGKIALVTGSGRGLGKDVAVYLAQLGATVVVNSFHSRQQGIATAEEITAAGGEAVHLWGSVANVDHVDTLFNEV